MPAEHWLQGSPAVYFAPEYQEPHRVDGYIETSRPYYLGRYRNQPWWGEQGMPTDWYFDLSGTAFEKQRFWECILEHLALETEVFASRVYVEFVSRASLGAPSLPGIDRVDGRTDTFNGKPRVRIASELYDEGGQNALNQVIAHEFAHALMIVKSIDQDAVCDLFDQPSSAWEGDTWQTSVKEAWCETMKDVWLEPRRRVSNNLTDFSIPKAKWYGPNRYWAQDDEWNWYNGHWSGAVGYDYGSDPPGYPWDGPMPDVWDYTGGQVWPVYVDWFESPPSWLMIHMRQKRKAIVSGGPSFGGWYSMWPHPIPEYPYDYPEGGSAAPVPSRAAVGAGRAGTVRS